MSRVGICQCAKLHFIDTMRLRTVEKHICNLNDEVQCIYSQIAIEL